MKRILKNQLSRHLEDYYILNDHQYGFRKNRATSDLLAYVLYRCREAIDKHGESLVISLDITKAFVRVWHHALLSMVPAYGLPKNLWKSISGFLHKYRIHAQRACPRWRLWFAVHICKYRSSTRLCSFAYPGPFAYQWCTGYIHCYTDVSTIHGCYHSKFTWTCHWIQPFLAAHIHQRFEAMIADW